MHIQLNEQNQFERNLPQGNIEFSDTVFQPAHTLTPEQCEQLRVHPLVRTEQPTFDPVSQGVRAADPALIEGQWTQQWEVYPLPAEEAAANFTASREAAWNRIKAERDRRRSLGVKVGEHWYHSDADSRIQQISLFVMGAAVPPVQWKTLATSPPPVFVTMTQAIAGGIFQNTAASDAAVFAAAEVHRIAMEASTTPESYDFSGGWPVSIEDAP